MLVLEDHCVGCPTCSISCNARHVEVHYCDVCGDPAEWKSDEYDYCDACMKDHLTEEFWDIHTIKSAAKYLDVRVEQA